MKLNFETLIIFVQDVDKLKSFYVDILKLEVLEEFESEWLLLGSGNCKIGLHKIGAQYLEEGAAPFKFDNNTKVVFEIDEDIHQVRTTLLSEGVSMKEVTTFEGYNYLRCDGEDPEGNVFQIKQRKQ